MASSVTHGFVSAKADDADTTLVRPSNWNADHVVAIDSDDISGTEWEDLTDGGETALHSHAGGASEATDIAYVDGDGASLLFEHIIPGPGITVTELASGSAVAVGRDRTLVETLSVGASASTVTFATTLNGDQDEVYEIEGHWISGSSSDLSLELRPNGGTTLLTSRVSGADITILRIAIAAAGNTSKEAYIWCALEAVASNSIARRFITHSFSTGTPQAVLRTFVGGGFWLDPSTNITSLTLGGGGANLVGAGSVFNLYKRPKASQFFF